MNMIDVYNAYGPLKAGDYDDLDFSKEGTWVLARQEGRDKAYKIERGRGGENDILNCHAQRVIVYKNGKLADDFKQGYTYNIYNGVRIGEYLETPDVAVTGKMFEYTVTDL